METFDRDRAEAQLVSLLNKALRQVPFVRLDAVENVTQAFQEALDYMEAHLDVGDSDDEHTSSNHSRSSASASACTAAQQHTLPTLLPSAPSAESEAHDSLSQSTLRVPAALKLIGSTVTRDYSSPSQSKRSLSKRSSGSLSTTTSAPSHSSITLPNAASSMSTSSSASALTSGTYTITPSGSKLGLGLKQAASNIASSVGTNTKTSLVSGHKPSSRAQNASPIPPSTDEDNAPDSASYSSSGQSSDNEEEIIRVARPLSGANILLSRAAGLSSSREFPSPKLGPRSLGTTTSNTITTSFTHSLGARGASVPNINVSVNNPSISNVNLKDQESASSDFVIGMPVNADVPLILTEPGQLDKEHDLNANPAFSLPGTDLSSVAEIDLVDEALGKRSDPLGKMKNEVLVPIAASPKQFRSSLRLLSLAASNVSDNSSDDTKNSKSSPSSPVSNGSHDIPPTVPSSSIISPANERERFNTSLLLSPLAFTASGTPKPAYLRRLDSPESHHGQLIAAKAKLSMLLNRALQTIPSIKSDALPSTERLLQVALNTLEHSTVQP